MEIICDNNEEIVGRVERIKQGWQAYDSRGRKIGSVVDIFGPVNRPYIRIKITKKPAGKILVGGDVKWRRRRIRRNG